MSISFINQVNSIQASIIKEAINSIQAKEAAKSQWLGLFVNVFQSELETEQPVEVSLPIVSTEEALPEKVVEVKPSQPKAKKVAKPKQPKATPPVAVTPLAKAWNRSAKPAAKPTANTTTEPKAVVETPTTEERKVGTVKTNWILTPEGVALLPSLVIPDGQDLSNGLVLNQTKFTLVKKMFKGLGLDHTPYIVYLNQVTTASGDTKEA